MADPSGGGDRHPPDNDAEKESLPKVGQIWQEISGKFSEPAFFRVMRIDYKKVGEDLKTSIFIRRIGQTTGEVASRQHEIKEGPNIFSRKYQFVAETTEDFLEQGDFSQAEQENENAPIPDQEKLEAEEEKPEEGISGEADAEQSANQGSAENESPLPNRNPLKEYVFTEHEKQQKTLEEALAEARLQFVQDDYEYATKSNKLTRFFGLKPGVIPERDPAHAKQYGEALKNLRDYEFAYLQSTLDTLPLTERKEKVESFLLKYRHQEAVELYSLGKEVQSLAENETLFGSVKTRLQEIGNGYRRLGFKKKIALTVGVVGLGALSGAGLAVAGIASAAYVAKRVAAGAAGYLAVDEGLNTYLSNRSNKKATKESQELANAFIRNEVLYQAEGKAAGRDPEAWESLLNATNEKLKDINKDLEKLKVRENRIKMAAFAAAIGLPAALSSFGALGDMMGGEAPASVPEGAPAVAAPSEMSEFPPENEAPRPSLTPESPVVTPPPVAEPITEAPAQAAEAAPAPSGAIGFEDTPLTPEQQYWIDIRNGQGTYTDSPRGDIHYDYEDRRPGGGNFHPASFDPSESRGNFQGGNQGFQPEPVEEAPTETSTSEFSEENKAVEESLQSGETPTETTDASTESNLSEANNPAAEDSASVSSEPANEEPADLLEGNQAFDSEALTENQEVTTNYSYEESRYQTLTEAERPLWRENMTLLRGELLDINNTEFGPNYTPGNWRADELWALHRGNSIQDIIAFDNPRYEHDPRDSYREWQWERTRNREIYLPPINPEPQLGSGPDPYAVHTMDVIEREYRHNISDMQRAAVERFGSAAMPISRNESVQEYMARLATLYTRARLENPDFRFKF